jgi:hypothetical protein
MNLHAFLSNFEWVAGTALAAVPARSAIFKNFLLFTGFSSKQWFDATNRLPLVIPVDWLHTNGCPNKKRLFPTSGRRRAWESLSS